MGVDWTDEEDAIVVELYRSCGARGLARTALRGRTVAAINTRATHLMNQGRIAPGRKGAPAGVHSIARPLECGDEIAERIERAHRAKRTMAEAGNPDLEIDDCDLSGRPVKSIKRRRQRAIRYANHT